MKRTTIVEIIALLFATLFLYTGIAKLMDYDVAKEQIGLTPLLAPIAGVVVIALPIIEIITAIFLFLPRMRKVALYTSLGLMVAFTGYIIYILKYNDTLPCTCGGVLETLSWNQHLTLNIGLILLSLTGILLNRRRRPAINNKRASLAHN